MTNLTYGYNGGDGEMDHMAPRSVPTHYAYPHLLLQMRTRVLNDELRQIFQRWYPSMKNNEEDMKLAA